MSNSVVHSVCASRRKRLDFDDDQKQNKSQESISSTFYVRISSTSVNSAAFLQLRVQLRFAMAKNLYKKRMRIILMKLTVGEKKTAERFSFKNTSMDAFQTSIIRKYSLYTTNGKAQTDSLATNKQVSLTLEKYMSTFSKPNLQVNVHFGSYKPYCFGLQIAVNFFKP